MKKITNLKVTDVGSDTITLEGNIILYSDHSQDCCEHHYLDMSQLDMSDFEGLTFDLSGDDFFNRIEGYGIELKPNNGWGVKIPGYGSNNGYYGSNIDLVVQIDGKEFKRFDVSECQVIND